MFKLLVLSALIALAVARPSGLVASAPYVTYNQPTVAIHQPALATVGAVVHTVPTSVSHASHSVVHKSAHVVQDVVAPVVRTSYVTPVLRTVSAPVYHGGYVSSSPYGTYAASPYSRVY
ncbi:retinin-like [Musca vetustissima]|uniref:retinin-like n=1 Tax=Musca vetustissima TaxID=27455 RepID=UPI002AB7C588|nr:retinin-like [Musca vetustissima]